MKLGPFQEICASVFGVEKKTIVVVTRALRESQLLTTGARGINAPEMTSADAANVTIALLSGAAPSRVVEVVRFYRSQTLWDDAAFSSDNVCTLMDIPKNRTAGEILETMFEVFTLPDEKLRPYLEEVEDYPSVAIQIKEPESRLSITVSTVRSGLTQLDFFDWEGAMQFPQAIAAGAIDPNKPAETTKPLSDEPEEPDMKVIRVLPQRGVIRIAHAICRNG